MALATMRSRALLAMQVTLTTGLTMTLIIMEDMTAIIITSKEFSRCR